MHSRPRKGIALIFWDLIIPAAVCQSAGDWELLDEGGSIKNHSEYSNIFPQKILNGLKTTLARET